MLLNEFVTARQSCVVLLKNKAHKALYIQPMIIDANLKQDTYHS